MSEAQAPVEAERAPPPITPVELCSMLKIAYLGEERMPDLQSVRDFHQDWEAQQLFQRNSLATQMGNRIQIATPDMGNAIFGSIPVVRLPSLTDPPQKHVDANLTKEASFFTQLVEFILGSPQAFFLVEKVKNIPRHMLPQKTVRYETPPKTISNFIDDLNGLVFDMSTECPEVILWWSRYTASLLQVAMHSQRSFRQFLSIHYAVMSAIVNDASTLEVTSFSKGFHTTNHWPRAAYFLLKDLLELPKRKSTKQTNHWSTTNGTKTTNPSPKPKRNGPRTNNNKKRKRNQSRRNQPFGPQRPSNGSNEDEDGSDSE
jgi:hypothetical protein